MKTTDSFPSPENQACLQHSAEMLSGPGFYSGGIFYQTTRAVTGSPSCQHSPLWLEGCGGVFTGEAPALRLSLDAETWVKYRLWLIITYRYVSINCNNSIKKIGEIESNERNIIASTWNLEEMCGD